MQAPVIEIRDNEYLIKLNRKHFDIAYLRKVLHHIGVENRAERLRDEESAIQDEELARYYDHLSEK
ncbi:MAG: hypothetical protein INR69_12890 [Mucilaginibacter polytrichastri]|nr:hypothetical protein [Mucilaginibacter polytrichastri]